MSAWRCWNGRCSNGEEERRACLELWLLLRKTSWLRYPFKILFIINIQLYESQVHIFYSRFFEILSLKKPFFPLTSAFEFMDQGLDASSFAQVAAVAAAAAAEEARRLRGEKRVLFNLEHMGLGSVCYHSPRRDEPEVGEALHIGQLQNILENG